jgi:nicotinamidase/pyrazinamidase
MTTPSFYTSERVGTSYTPNIIEATKAGSQANLSPAQDDQEQIYLLLVDVQVDFVHPDGALPVAGAVEDTRRLIDWMYRNVSQISKIGITLDSHVPIQIFHPAWWVNQAGEHPNGYTAISYQDILDEVWRPIYDVEWSKHYVEVLEKDAKKQLMIWPYHVLLGTVGQTLVPAVAEAVAYHSVGRKIQPNYVIKGLIPQTENYSAIEPEVKYPDHPQSTVNQALLNEMARYDKIYITGQAKSHCVLETVASMLRHYSAEQIGKIHLLTDTMSSVGHPEIDFDGMANAIFADWEKRGVKLVTTHS